MELNQVMNLLANNVALNEKKADNANQDNNLVAFKNYLSEAGYTQESSAARNIREDIENRLQKISFGSPKVKLTVSPKVYENMAKDPNIKKKMDAIFDDYLSEKGTLSWMIKEARVGGGEISLTIDNDGNTTYTGKLYGIPGWDEKEESSYSSKISSNKLITLLKEKNSINNTCDFHYINNLNNNNDNNNLNQLIMGSQLLRTAYQKK